MYKKAEKERVMFLTEKTLTTKIEPQKTKRKPRQIFKVCRGLFYSVQ